MRDGGAAAGVLYIDSHQIAATKGIVNSVSFYVDRTCAFANIEFAAFDLIDRDTDINQAHLRLAHRSGSIKLDSSDLKSYMTLVTVGLCNPGETITPTGATCKGTKFAVDPHQYIGVRSDKCRLGFAPTPADPILATTWVSQRMLSPDDGILIYDNVLFRNQKMHHLTRLLSRFKQSTMYQVTIPFFIQSTLNQLQHKQSNKTNHLHHQTHRVFSLLDHFHLVDVVLPSS